MTLFSIGLNNLRRRLGKSLSLGLAVVFAVATVVILVATTIALKADMERQILKQGTILVITPERKQLEFSYGGLSVGGTVSYDEKRLPAEASEILAGTKAVDIVAPKLLQVDKVADANVLLVGSNIETEMKLRDYWQVVLGSAPTTSKQILVGAEAAKKLELKPNQQISLLGRDFQVAGILAETGKEEDNVIVMNYESLGALQGTSAPSFVEVKAFADHQPSRQELDALTATIKEKLPQGEVKVLTSALQARQELLDRFQAFSVIISLLVVVISGLIIAAFVMASIGERTREIGVLRAIGFRRKHIIKLVLYEITMIIFCSSLLGYIIGIGIAGQVGSSLVGLETAVGYQPVLGLTAGVGALLLGLASAYFPAKKAAAIDPVEALRYF